MNRRASFGDEFRHINLQFLTVRVEGPRAGEVSRGLAPADLLGGGMEADSGVGEVPSRPIGGGDSDADKDIDQS